VKLLHTSLPEFKRKLAAAAAESNKEFKLSGVENLKSAKMQSLRTGRVTAAIDQVAADKNTARVEVAVIPRVPETMQTVIVKGYDKDGKPTKAVLETLNIIHPGEEAELEGFTDITDKRPKLGNH
jgi:hypothetical protein